MSVCPVAAILDYRVRRGSHPGPFFIFSDGRFLTRACLVSRLKVALVTAGVGDMKYSGHNLRIGAATTVAACGVQDSLIKTLGRWESAAYMPYVRTPRETLYNVSRMLVEQAGSTYNKDCVH